MSYTLLLFTAYAIVRTVPSANRPNRGKKKATQEKRHKTDKEKEDSTDTAAKRQVAQDQSKVKRQEDRKKEGACSRKKRAKKPN